MYSEQSSQEYPKSTHLFAVDFNIGDVVFENGRHINVGELIFAEDDQQASLAACAVADDDEFLANRRHRALYCRLSASRQASTPPRVALLRYGTRVRTVIESV